jgi:hypothetical protein
MAGDTMSRESKIVYGLCLVAVLTGLALYHVSKGDGGVAQSPDTSVPAPLVVPVDVCVINGVPQMQLLITYGKSEYRPYPYVSYIDLNGDYVAYSQYHSYRIEADACPMSAR